MSLVTLSFPPPVAGAFLGGNPRLVPADGAVRLENLRVDDGLARSRSGSVALLNTPDSKRVIDLHNPAFADGTVETIRCVRDGTRRANVSGGAWDAITLDTAWTGTDTDRFWAVVSPWGTETKGRIIVGNGIDTIKSWAGLAGTMAAVAGAVPARYGIVGDDNRLFIAHTTEGGSLRAQRVRWTIIALTNGSALDWTNPGSGAIDLRNDAWPITALWKQSGVIYVGKSRAVCRLIPTGLSTDAYGYETLQTNGDGVFCRGSLAQHGNLVSFLSHRDVILFDGVTFNGIGGRVRRELYRRLNYAALDQVTSIVDAENNRIGWGLPLDGSATPTEIWWYEIEAGRWEIDKRAHTALSLFTNVDITTIDELAGTIDALAGTIDSLSAASSSKAEIIYGLDAGGTKQFSSTAASDDGMTIAATYTSSSQVPIGQTITIAGREHVISDEDFLVLDEVALTLLDLGSTYVLGVDVSGDGGVTFTSLGLRSLTTGGGSVAVPRFVYATLNQRTPVKDAVQVRLRGLTGNVRWGFSDLIAKVDIVGRKR